MHCVNISPPLLFVAGVCLQDSPFLRNDIQHYKLIAKHIIKFGLKAPTAYKLAALYLIDSITKIDKRKASDELLSAVSQYTSEFEKSIDSIVEVILTSGSDKDKVRFSSAKATTPA